jgi:sulfur carrier protein ThiS
MRMHRGSSKAGREANPPTETLPLSASTLLSVTVDVGRAGTPDVRTVQLPPGSLVRDAVRAVGQAPEGCVVLLDSLPLPLDEPLRDSVRLTVVPAFSGG